MTEKELVARHGETVRQVLCSLLGATPSPRLLSEITGLPEQDWLADYPYEGDIPDTLPRKLSLPGCLSGVPDAMRLFAELSPKKDYFFESLHLAARGREMEAVEALLQLAGRLQSRTGPESINALTLLAMRSLLGLRLSGRGGLTARYLTLCFRLFPLLVACGCHIPSPALLFHRARGLARRLGDRRLAAFFALMIGATNMCNHAGHDNARRHAIMGQGREELLGMVNPDDLLLAAPYFGIWHFMEGEYDEAMREFQLASLHMRKDGQTMMELFCLRHWCFSAFNLGLFEYAEHQLQSRLRQFSPRNDNQLARTIRGQLAGCFLRTGKLENALEHLDTAQFGISPRHDIVSWISNSRQLAYYHILNGNLDSAWHVFRSALEEANIQHYQSPLYLSCVLLEILAVFRKNAFPPLPCYDLRKEVERCLRGPNRLLRGIACRILGDIRLEEDKRQEARELYDQSLTILHGISVLEQSKTHLRLAALHLADNRKKAAVHALRAWPQHDSLRHFWSEELEALIPAHIRAAENRGPTRQSILTRYRENLSSIPFSADGATFALNLLVSSCHILGATYGFLFRCKEQEDEVELLASAGPEGPYEPGLSSIPFRDFIHLTRDGRPQIFDKVFDPLRPDEGGRMLVGIPVEGGPAGRFILCHDHLNDPDIRYLLHTELLEEIGELAGKALAGNARILTAPPETPRRRKLSLAEHTEIISASPALKAVLEKAEAIADTDASVLIAGESGVGKDLVARRLHERSGRSGSMVALNMAGLSDDLLASELFGHEKGAFTGAQAAKPGLVELARNGTLFLDEISEASAGAQASLLRILENRQFYRVGGTQPLSADFRLVTASNRDLRHAVAQGRFRRDLYYRISGVVLSVPPLRDRPEDITALAFYYLHYFASRHGRACVPKFSEPNMRKLLAHAWPGNVRELKNVVEQAVLFSAGHEVELDALPPRADVAALPQTPQPARPDVQPAARRSPSASTGVPGPQSPFSLLTDFPSLAEMEQRYIRMVLDMTGGKINGASGALDILKMNRSTLYARLKEYGLRKQKEG